MMLQRETEMNQETVPRAVGRPHVVEKVESKEGTIKCGRVTYK
jgi:hypothetical protein